LNSKQLIKNFTQRPKVQKLISEINDSALKRFHLKGLVGSFRSLIASSVFDKTTGIHLFILPDKETAAYFYNDMESVFEEKSMNYSKKKILFFPTSYKRPYEIETLDGINILLRTEVLNRITTANRKTAVVTFPEALCEKVVTKKYLKENTFQIKTGEELSIDNVIDILLDFKFDMVDFVADPGQFSLRGGIVDVFSFSNDYPFRIEFFGDEVESIRAFDPGDQLSLNKLSKINVVPNVQDRGISEERESVVNLFPTSSIFWIDDVNFSIDKIEDEFKKAQNSFKQLENDVEKMKPSELFINGETFLKKLFEIKTVEFGKQFYFTNVYSYKFDILPQPSFNKKFELLIRNLQVKTKEEYLNIIFSDNPKQIERLKSIFEDIQKNNGLNREINFSPLYLSLHEGFIDRDEKLTCYTDHQIFDRYHRFYLKDRFSKKESVTLKEIHGLKPGDYVTHIDHGVGQFGGLEKIENNGKQQEAIRLVYKNNDLLYVSIHSLHRIAKFVSKEGTVPKLNKLGSNAWEKLKSKTKKKVKDIAKDLIKLYAERKSAKGYQCSPDTYMQHELESSFIYEDTPDQLKATVDVKADLEKSYPMDRLVCGDVGFGKTEIAIRAAFKVASESKQIALLVPTTILALQHYKTFSSRLHEFPVKVDYINRFKSTKQQQQTLSELKEGKIDIIIGTHRIVSQDVEFKDLGLLIIDEEQKFGVSIKEKLKKFKINVDTLTLTATPIPRTLQFSLMGARDLSIINTPPPNRHPVHTEICPFSEEIIHEGIMYEIARGGQVFFVHNRVKNILDVQEMINRFVPGVKVAVAHGQMEGRKLEKIMVDFINGDYDVLLATTIIESGLDIPNVNTIFINGAQNFGLSDLHQLRGRVGRANKKAFCYLIAPPISTLTGEARKRLKAIEEYSDLGSGFNIAMRDLDIRGAGNILGAEQSGFISEIGFETYHKILDEAILELKETEFKDVFNDSVEEIKTEFVKDCIIETDLEILIPDEYISSITERLSLYKELDNIESEEKLSEFKIRLNDRFGPVPSQTIDLINTIRLRWLAKTIGFEKLILKNKRFIGYFISNQESSYYQSPVFSFVLKFVQNNTACCNMREYKNKLILSFKNISSVDNALRVLEGLTLETKIVNE